MKRIEVSAKPDNQGLEPLPCGPSFTGAVSEVNGDDSLEVREFAPTKNELKELLHYWYTRQLDNDYARFALEYSGSMEWRLALYSRRRINRITELLSDEEIKKILHSARSRYREKYKLPDEEWDRFTRAWPIYGREFDREAVINDLRTGEEAIARAMRSMDGDISGRRLIG